MKEMFLPVQYDVKKNVSWFIDQYCKSAFREGGDEDLKLCLERMFNEAIEKQRIVEERKIEQCLYDHPIQILKMVFLKMNIIHNKQREIDIALSGG